MFWVFKMSLVEIISFCFFSKKNMTKRQHKENNLKLEALLKLENEKQTKRFWYSLIFSPDTLFTWKKKKDNFKKRPNLNSYDHVHIVVLKWFKRKEEVPISYSVVKGKSWYFVKKLSYKKVQLSAGCLSKWKN